MKKPPSPTRRIFGLLVAFLLAISFLPLVAIMSEPVQAQDDEILVTWTPMRNGIISKSYIIQVQNLADETRKVKLDVLFENTNFVIDKLRNVVFYEWEALLTTVTVYDYDNVFHENAPIYGDEFDENGFPVVVGYENQWRWEVVGSHLENRLQCRWTESKMQTFKVEVETGKWEGDVGEITLPKSDSEATHDDYGTVETANGTKWFRIEFDVPITETPKGWGSSGKVALVIDNAEYHPVWSDGWQYKKKITIDCAKVENENLDNFPVLVSWSSDSDLADHALDNGDDIAFVNSAETWQFDHEIEYFDGDNGQLIAHVRVPTLYDNENVSFWMFYGNLDASPQENPTGVWDDNFVAVWHMVDNTASSILDSTSNNNDGTKTGANEPIENDGQIYMAQDFDGSDDRVAIADPVFNSDFFTISAWVYERSYSGNQGHGIFYQGTGASDYGTHLILYYGFTSGGVVFRVLGSGIADPGPFFNLDEWFHVAAVNDNRSLRVYVNGAEVSTGSTIYSPVANPCSIGVWHNYADASRFFDGIIDEPRISDTARGAGWIKTTFNNHSDPASFYTVGSEEEAVFPPDKPELVKPVENQPYFEWTDVGVDNYRLLVDNNIDFSSPCENRVLIENYYQIPAENSLEDGVYYWKVTAYNEMGENTSDVWSFVVGEVGEVGEDENLYVAMSIAALAAGIGVIIWAFGINQKEEKTKKG